MKDGAASLEYTYLPNQTNVVSGSTNLVEWLPLETQVSDQTGSFKLRDTEQQSVRFYRVQPMR